MLPALDLVHVGLACLSAFLAWRMSQHAAPAPAAPANPIALPSAVAPGGWLAHLLQLGSNVHNLLLSPALPPLAQAALNWLQQLGAATSPATLPAPPATPGSTLHVVHTIQSPAETAEPAKAAAAQASPAH